jgi:hypothetical protein
MPAEAAVVAPMGRLLLQERLRKPAHQGQLFDLERVALVIEMFEQAHKTDQARIA